MAGRSTDISGAFNTVAITPSQTTVIPGTRGVYVGVTGDVAVRMVSGNDFIYKNAEGGTEHPWQVDKVYLTGTTATFLGAMY